jgi:hypothetical protein
MPWQPSTRRRALERATAALLADAARSDGLIAAIAGITAQTVARARRVLEQRGLIDPVPVRERAGLPHPPQPSRARAAIEAGASTPREVADAAGVSIQAAWKMLRGTRWPVADAAGAIDGISIRKTSIRKTRKSAPKWNVKPPTEDYMTPLASRDPRTRAPRLYRERDAETESFCIACTPVWGAGWEHDQSCPFR